MRRAVSVQRSRAPSPRPETPSWLSVAVDAEVAPRGVRVVAVLPGLTDTAMGRGTTMSARMVQSPEVVASVIVRACDGRAQQVVSGVGNRLLVRLARVAPAVGARVMRRLARQALDEPA